MLHENLQLRYHQKQWKKGLKNYKVDGKKLEK